jgi:Icc-related predicted phosphoesterase
MFKIAAVSDVHSPLFFEIFKASLETIKEPKIFFLLGDIYERGYSMKEYRKVVEAIRKKFTCPIVACFGNDEFEQDYEKIKADNPEVIFLVDEKWEGEIDGRSIDIVGTKGCLDKPTWWQKRNIPNIEGIYRERLERIRNLLNSLKAEIKILISHYALTYKTLEGEKPERFGGLGCKKFEKILIETKPTLAMHGHSHHGKPFTWVNSVPVFNVAIPLNKSVVEIDIDNLPKRGLEKFW